MKTRRTNLFLAAALSSAALVTSAFAARLYKDVTTTDLNDVANWATTSGGATDPASIGTTDALRFNEIFAPTGGTDYTTSLSAALAVGGIQLDSGSANGGLATGNIIIPAGNTLTLNGASATDINYAAAGIVLNSASGGTLTIDANVDIGANQQWVTSRALTVTGAINLGTNTLSFNTAGASNVMTLSGVISGTGSLNKTAGPGTLILANTENTFSGTVTLVGGNTNITKLANGGANSSLGSGTGNIVLNGANLVYTGAAVGATARAIEMRAGAGVLNNSATAAITLNASDVIQGGTASARTMTLGGSNAGDNTFGSVLGDSGTSPNITTLTKSGIGKWILAGSNTYSGTTNVNAGTLVLGNTTNTIADTSNITVNGGTLDLGTNNDTVGTVTLTTGSITGSSGVLSGTSYAVSAGSITAILGGTGALTKSGAGTVTLSGTNTYSGATAVNDGILVFGTKVAQSASTTVTSLAAGAAGLGVHNTDSTYFNATDVGNLFNATLAGFSLDAASAVAVDTTNSGGSFDQTVALTGSRSLVKTGTGTLILSTANSYTGTTRINQGTVSVTGSGVLGGASGSSSDTGNIVFGQNLNSGALQFETVTNLGPASQIRFRNTGGTAGLGGALVYVGTTEQTLGKTLQCDTSIGIRLESNSVGGKLLFNGAFSQTNRPLYLGGTGTGDNTLATGFAGSGGITKRDAGTWILTGANTSTGATIVTGGTLTLGASDVLANTTAVSIGTATLAAAAAINDTVGTLDPTAAATINLGAGATLAFADSSAIDWTGGTLNITGPFAPGSSLRFGTTNAGLTSTQLALITVNGTGTFSLDASGFLVSGGNYSSWATTNGVPGQAANLDHDNDGVSNGVEYFIGGPTGNTTGFTTLPGVTNTGGTLSVTWTKAANYTGTYGTDFVVETSETLAGTWATEIVSPNSGFTVTISGNNVTYTFPAGTRKFARLRVTGP